MLAGLSRWKNLRIPPVCWAAVDPMGKLTTAQSVRDNVKNRLTINIPFQNTTASLPNLSTFRLAGNDQKSVGRLPASTAVAGSLFPGMRRHPQVWGQCAVSRPCGSSAGFDSEQKFALR